MLSSIHPLGERARGNRWGVTVGAFTVAATAVGSLVGALLGTVGSFAVSSVRDEVLLMLTAVAALGAGLLDWIGVTTIGPERQVNESWIGHYRGWVYGGSFGAELGTGVMTYIVTWGVFAMFVGEFLSASTVSGAAIGAVFGFGRSVALLLAGQIDRPSSLVAFHERMASLGPQIRVGSAVGTSALGALGTLGYLL